MMNKKEQAALDQLKAELRLAKALRWTEPVAPDVPIPENSYCVNLAKGWLFNAYINSPRVDVACTNSINHSFGSNDKTTTQGARELYSSKLKALLAMRHEVEIKCASLLADIDAKIEEARKDTK